MEIGIFSKTYEASELEEVYRRMTADGIFHTQFNFSSAGLPTLPEEVPEEAVIKIRELTKQYQVKLDVLSGTFNMIAPDLEERQLGCRQFRTQCRLAQELAIPIVSLCTGSKNPESKWKWHEDNVKQSSWDDLMHTTEEILSYAEEFDVILGIETEASNIICTPELARKYMDAWGSEHIKIIMDGANLFRPEQVTDMKAVLDHAFEILGKDIVLAHAKDFDLHGNLEFVAAGEGILDFSYYITLLKKYEYRGSLVMHGLSEQQVSASKRFLEGLM